MLLNREHALPTSEPDAGPVQAPAKPSHATISTDLKANLCKAVAVAGFQPDQAAKVQKIARKAGSVASIEPEVPQDIARFAKLQQDGCEGPALLVHYKSVKDAIAAVAKLHRRTIGAEEAKTVLWARQVNGEGANVSTLTS